MTTEYDPNCDCSECARAERDYLRAQMQPLPAGHTMTTAIELLERRNAQLLDALESMTRQHCSEAPATRPQEPLITNSCAISANAYALELLAEEGRFRIVRGFGRVVVGYWPENDPEAKP